MDHGLLTMDNGRNHRSFTVQDTRMTIHDICQKSTWKICYYCLLPIVDCLLPIANCQLPIVDCLLLLNLFMRKVLLLSSLVCLIVSAVSFTNKSRDEKNLREIYSQHPSQWPKPFVDNGVDWKELGILPESPIQSQMDSLQAKISLGSSLFFDTRMSGSGKISCSTCHQPELSWTDKKPKSVGHEGTLNKRNSPSLQNVWFYKKLFWDGRSYSLEDQAFAPINSESEMHSEMRALPRQLRKAGYEKLFEAAYGDAGINADRIAEALAVFQRTIVSRRNRFDEFLAGNKDALNDAELRGMHLFRTKARCINCHNGPLFSDNEFHNTGLAGNDNGLYQVTHKDEDLGKFKTPILRDVVLTAPWMHNGQFERLDSIINIYNKGQRKPGKDKLLKKLNLSQQEKKDLLAFLGAISAPPVEFKKPVLPGL